MLRAVLNIDDKMEQVMDNLENDIFNVKLMKMGGASSIEFYLFWKQKLWDDLRKIRWRYLHPRKRRRLKLEDDYSDDFYFYNFEGNLHRRRCVREYMRLKIYRLYHHMYKHRENSHILTCKRTGMSIEISDFEYDKCKKNDYAYILWPKFGVGFKPPSDENITLFNLQSTGGKRNPFSLRHLCAIEIIADGTSKLSISTLEKIYSFIAFDRFAMRCGVVGKSKEEHTLLIA